MLPEPLSSAPWWICRLLQQAQPTAAGAAVAEVIVVGADHDRLLGQRPRAVQHADDVLQGDLAAVHLDFQADGPARQVEAVRLGSWSMSRSTVGQVDAGAAVSSVWSTERRTWKTGRLQSGGRDGGEVEVEQVVAGLGRVGVVDEEDGGGLVLLGVGDLAAQRRRRLEAGRSPSSLAACGESRRTTTTLSVASRPS